MAMVHNGEMATRGQATSSAQKFVDQTSKLQKEIQDSLPKSTLQYGNRIGISKGYVNFQPEVWGVRSPKTRREGKERAGGQQRTG